jgi:hypothetical protein
MWFCFDCSIPVVATGLPLSSKYKDFPAWRFSWFMEIFFLPAAVTG